MKLDLLKYTVDPSLLKVKYGGITPYELVSTKEYPLPLLPLSDGTVGDDKGPTAQLTPVTIGAIYYTPPNDTICPRTTYVPPSFSIVNENVSVPLSVAVGALLPCHIMVCADPPICTAFGIYPVPP